MTARSADSRTGRDRRPALPGAAGWLPAVLGLALVLASCGNKEPPRPPVRLVPEAAKDLRVSQRGLELQLSLSYPTTTTAGQPLPGLTAVEVWQLTRPLQPPEETPEETAEPAPTEGQEEAAPAEEEPPAEEPPPPPLLFRRPAGTDERQAEERIEVDAREFAAGAAVQMRIEGPELEAAISGDRILLRLPIAEPPASEEDGEVHVYAVTTVSLQKLSSQFSNLVKILPRRPPAPPPALEVKPWAPGIVVAWAAEDPAVGFRVYRRDAGSRSYLDPLARPGAAARKHVDTSARFGTRYVYSVTAVSQEGPLIESALAAEREVDYQDRFPPQPPTGLVILAEPGSARLLWEPSPDDDLAGYRVYRRVEGEVGFTRLSERPGLALEYLDADVLSGRRYAYYVTAVDLTGNESTAGETAEARIP